MSVDVPIHQNDNLPGLEHKVLLLAWSEAPHRSVALSDNYIDRGLA